MIRVIIAEDEKPARERLKSFLIDYPDFEIIAEVEDGEATVSQVNSLKPDVLFLDIQMPKGNGFNSIKKMEHLPVIVFTTAYDEYALEAFNVHALDYLLKPFSKERFQRTVYLIQKNLGHQESYNERIFQAMEDMAEPTEYLERLSVQNGYVYRILNVEEIVCIKTIDGLVYVESGKQKYQTDTTLNQFEKRLNPSKFMRVHRNAVVNLKKIAKIIPWGQGQFSIEMENTSTVHISRSRLQEFKVRVGMKI